MNEAQPTANAARKRLHYQCWHRGMREMDLILGGFADRHLAGLSGEDCGALMRLLEMPDSVLYGWLSGRDEAPAEIRTPLYTRLKAFVDGALR